MTIALTEKLQELGIDLVVLAGFMTILTEEMVSPAEEFFEMVEEASPSTFIFTR